MSKTVAKYWDIRPRRPNTATLRPMWLSRVYQCRPAPQRSRDGLSSTTIEVIRGIGMVLANLRTRATLPSDAPHQQHEVDNGNSEVMSADGGLDASEGWGSGRAVCDLEGLVALRF